MLSICGERVATLFRIQGYAVAAARCRAPHGRHTTAGLRRRTHGAARRKSSVTDGIHTWGGLRPPDAGRSGTTTATGTLTDVPVRDMMCARGDHPHPVGEHLGSVGRTL